MWGIAVLKVKLEICMNLNNDLLHEHELKMKHEEFYNLISCLQSQNSQWETHIHSPETQI